MSSPTLESTSAAVVCDVTTFAKLKTTLADSDAYSTQLIGFQQRATSLRLRIMNAYDNVVKGQLSSQSAQYSLASVPYSSERSMWCSEYSRDMSYDRYSYSQNMYSVSYSLRSLQDQVQYAVSQRSSTCVSQGTLDLEASVRKDISEISLMIKSVPSVLSLCSLLPR